MKKILYSLAFTLVTCSAVLAQVPLTLLKDAGKNASYFSYPQEMTRVGSLLYFSAENDIYGRELWASDGTADGTRLVKDANPGPGASNPTNLRVVNNTLYFIAAGALWVTDGTIQGTEKLNEESGISIIGSINDNLVFGTWPLTGRKIYLSDGTKTGTKQVEMDGEVPDLPTGSIVFKDELYFRGRNADYLTLWKTNGTVEGTRFVTNLPGQGGMWTTTSDYIFFTFESSDFGNELWRSDGTAAAPVMIKDISPGWAPTHFTGFATLGDKVVFSAMQYGFDHELYITDGTEQGTKLLKDVFPGTGSSYPGEFRFDEVRDQLLFTATTAAGRELWRTDGTGEGTHMIRDIYPGPESSVFNIVENGFFLKNHFYFTADDGTHGNELWKTDGVSAVMVKDAVPGPPGSHFANFDITDNKFYCEGATYIWQSDGSGAGTTMISLPGFLNVSRPRYVNGKIFFVGAKGYYEGELYITDGIAAGARQVKLIDISNNLDPFNISKFGEWNGNLFFFSDGSLWKTNGTPSGTILMKEKSFGNFEGLHNSIGVAGNAVVFSAADQVHGIELWKSDGTAAGTTLLKDIRAAGSSDPAVIKSVNGISFFTAFTSEHGRELWRTDGTVEGTFLLNDFYPGTESGDLLSYSEKTIVINNVLYFFSNTADYGPALCRSDGSVAGTFVVKDINPGTGYINGSFTAVIDNIGYFYSSNGINGNELWRTDGTGPGTYMVKDIYPGAGESYIGLKSDASAILGNYFYFRATDVASGAELWKSDGTEAGTVRVADLNAGSASSYPVTLAALGNSLIVSSSIGLWQIADTGVATLINGAIKEVYSAYTINNKAVFTFNNDNHGEELWVTDGTVDGTHLLKDIREGTKGSDADNFFIDGAYLYFTANDGESIQLWRTDGTLCGTKKLTQDPDALIVSNLRKLNSNLIMWANSLNVGAELHSYSLSTSIPAGCPQLQSITFHTLPSKSYTDSDFTLPVSVDSPLPLEITSSDPSIIKVENGIAFIKGAGTAYVTASQAGNYTYTPAETVRRKFIVNKSPVTVNVRDATRVYGDQNPVFTLEYSGFKAGETHNVIDEQPEAITTATVSSDVGEYTISVRGGHDKNYNMASQQGTITVTPARLSVTANDATRVYGAANPQFTASFVGFKLGQNQSVLSSPVVIETSATEESGVGEYPLNVSGGVASANNYDFEYVSGVLEIRKADQSITFNSISAVVDGDEFLLTATSSAGIPIAFMASGNIQISNDQARAIAPGAASITATQPGNENFNAASPVANNFCVNPLKPVLVANESLISIQDPSADLTYQWFRNATELPGENDATLVLKNDGIYTATASFSDCVSEPSNQFVYLVTSIGLGESATQIYPNPASKVITVKPRGGRVAITISSANGTAPIYESTINGEHSIDVTKWARGVYIIKIESAGGIVFGKVVLN